MKFEMNSKSENGYKPMTDKQRSYIERLLMNRSIDEDHKRYVKNALQNGLSSSQASGIIDFLKNLIEFRNFLDAGRDSAGGDILKKPRFENALDRDIGKSEGEVIVDHLERV